MKQTSKARLGGKHWGQNGNKTALTACMVWHGITRRFSFFFGCCHLNVSWLYTCTHIHMLCSLLSEQNSRQSTAAGPSTTTICKFKNQTRKERKGKRGKPAVHESGSSHHHRQSHTHIGEMGGRKGWLVGWSWGSWFSGSKTVRQVRSGLLGQDKKAIREYFV